MPADPTPHDPPPPPAAPPPIVLSNELLRDNFVDCVRRIKLKDFLGGEVITAAATGGVASAVNFGVDFNRNRFLGGKLGVIIEAADALLCNLYGEAAAEPEPAQKEP